MHWSIIVSFVGRPLVVLFILPVIGILHVIVLIVLVVDCTFDIRTSICRLPIHSACRLGIGGIVLYYIDSWNMWDRFWCSCRYRN